MQLIFASFLFFSLVIYASAQYQLDPSEYYVDTHFRGGSQSSSFDAAEVDERFIKTLSLTLTTTTITSTIIILTSCTTSTGGLSICTASGRRRRGLHLSGNKEGRGLFYNENEEISEDGTVFLPLSLKEEEKPIQPEVVPTPEENVAAKAIPFVVQPGFSAAAGEGRVLLYFGTSTTTITTTTTSTSSLTATCQSTSGFPLCGSLGK